MAKYKWNLYEIRNNIKTLEELYQNETNIYIKEHIMFYINMYNTIIDLAINKKCINDKEEFLCDNLDNANIENLIEELILSYQNNNLKVLDTILQSYIEFENTYNDKFIMKDIPIANTNQDIIMVSEDFGDKMLPKEINKRFMKALKTESLINITYIKKNHQYSGSTFFDPILNNKYIYVSRNNNIMDLIVIPHELFHYLYSDYNITLTENYSTYYNAEVEGSFANILFGDYFYNNYNEDRNYFNEFFLELHYSTLSELMVANCFLDSTNDNKKIRMNKLNKNLNCLGLKPFENEKQVLDYLTTPLDINMMYSFSYLVGIDLYYIYKKDPELAFYLLKNIKYIKQENDIFTLLRRNGITFMDDGYENLKKYIKKIERQSE